MRNEMIDGILKLYTKSDNVIVLEERKLRKSMLILRAINHELRQKIVKLLSERSPLAVTDIYVSLRVEQSVASQHLAILRKAGIVNTQRNGKYVYYRLNYNRLDRIEKATKRITG